jgi:hypothetical protein
VWPAVAAIILVAATPIVTLQGSSGGFDLFSTFFLTLVFVALYHFCAEPRADRFALLWVTLMVFANIRYESAIIVVVVLAGLLLFRKIQWAFLSEWRWLYVGSPLLMLPLLAQRILVPVAYGNEAGVAPFGWSHFWKWTGVFIQAQLDWRFFLPYVPLFNWLAVAVVLYAVVRLVRRPPNWADGKTQALVIMLAAVGASSAIIFAYFFGDCTHPATTRFFLNLAILAALAPVLLHVLAPKLWPTPPLLLFSAIVFCLYHPVAIEDRMTNSQSLIRETGAVHGFLKRLARKDNLTITERPGQLCAMDYGAVDFRYASEHATDILAELKRHLYSDVFVMQHIKYADGQPIEKDQLASAFQLLPVEEFQVTAGEYVRISKVRVLSSAVKGAPIDKSEPQKTSESGYAPP